MARSASTTIARGRAPIGYEAVIRNLRDPKSGDAMRVDIALQGPEVPRHPAGDGRGR